MNAQLTPAQKTTYIVSGILIILLVAGGVLLRKGKRWLVNRAFTRTANTAATGAEVIPRPWLHLRAEVEANNRGLNRDVFEHIRQLFLEYYAGGKANPANLIREYAQDEFLMIVDEHGQPLQATPKMIADYQNTAKANPLFKRWLSAGTLPEGEYAGAPVLLVARWLCHLIGLRHATVEIYLDPLEQPGHTYVQVRGMGKFEAPGALDIPCAGHITGLDAPEAAINKELSEELNLTVADLQGLHLVGRYNSYRGGASDPSINNEHRILYRAQIKAEAVERIRFIDGEVAGISIFAVDELRALIQRNPEKIASGLSDAIGLYE